MKVDDADQMYAPENFYTAPEEVKRNEEVKSH